MSNIVKLIPKHEPDEILEEAIGKLDSVIVIGADKEGFEYFTTSETDSATILWMIERLKYILLDIE